jgi:16S rRNA G527 N7-methylase RsmG
VGVPGLLSGLVSGDLWILSESERRKADFLINTVEKLDLKNIQVRAERAEVVLRSENCNSVVSRAVGKVNNIYSFVWGCSTWNNLVLFKGPGWTEEWDQFRKDRRAKELELTESYPYEVGSSAKRRLIIRLDRVPRGTVR